MAQPKLHTFEAGVGNKTYKTIDNAKAAVRQYFETSADPKHANLRYIIVELDNGRYKGRFIPVFIGQDALQAMLHFKFHVIV